MAYYTNRYPYNWNVNNLTAGGDLDVDGDTTLDGTTIDGVASLNSTTYISPGPLFFASGYIDAKAGGGQSGATQAKYFFTTVKICASDYDSVVLPAISENYTTPIAIKNITSNIVAVYPTTDEAIDGLGNNNPYYLGPGAVQMFNGYFRAQWYTMLTPNNTVTGITAYSGGGQANAVELSARYNVVGTVAAADDSVKLPATPVEGQIIEVVNDGANDLAIFPGSGDDLGNGADTAYYLHSGSVQKFVAKSSSAWARTNRALRFVSLESSPVTYDETNFTTQDGSYNDVDLTSSIPKSCYASGLPLYARLQVDHATATRSFNVRTDGVAGGLWVTTGTSGKNAFQHGMVAPSSSGVIEYSISSTGTNVDLAILGYWVEG